MAEPQPRPLCVTEWGMSPSFWAYSKCFAAFIHGLVPVPDVPGAFAHRGHPVLRVEICGMVVEVHQYTPVQ